MKHRNIKIYQRKVTYKVRHSVKVIGNIYTNPELKKKK